MKIVIGTVIRGSFSEIAEKCVKRVVEGKISFEEINDHLSTDMFNEDAVSNYLTDKEAWLKAITQEDIRDFLKHFGAPFALETYWVDEAAGLSNDELNELFNDSYNETFVQFLK